MKKTEKMIITIEYLQSRVNDMSKELARLNKLEEELGELTPAKEEMRARVLSEMEKYQSIISTTELEMRLQKIKDDEEDWTYEKEIEMDNEAHAQATLENENIHKIPLAEWARRNNIDPANARQKALRGTLVTAEKVGNTWMIDENENVRPWRRK